MKSNTNDKVTGRDEVRMSQMYRLEICQCTKVKQLGKVCKSCGSTSNRQATEEAAVLQELTPALRKAVQIAVEDEIERARR